MLLCVLIILQEIFVVQTREKTMSLFFLSSGQAASVIITNSLLGKFYMTGGFRLRLVLAKDKREKNDILAGDSFQTAHAAQLNEAEWSPLLLAGLLYLSSKGIQAPAAATFSAVGSVLYLWAKVFFPFPSYLPGAVFRYLGLGLLCLEIYQNAN